ncbi:hypothetical protein [Hymenobacter baengnokdamensis]|uniref:hypothetical protein n=1 Tax=Hymenobacter baengnokdamensis TaxID=2615203 RepID=UPI001244CA84|nr:hypothetical protein [Hymenobacter baengnokdamensis]
MAVLPDEQTGQVTWQAVDVDTINSRIKLPLEAVLQDGVTNLLAYKRQLPRIIFLTRRLGWQPVIKRNGRYWTTQNEVLTEYFLVRTQPLWFAAFADNVTLNCGAQPFSPADLVALQKRVAAAFPNPATRPNVAFEVAGAKLVLASSAQQVYTFWSIPVEVFDAAPEILYTGAVELKFKPGVGVISGKYPKHFHMSNDNGYNTFFDTVSTEIISSPK